MGAKKIREKESGFYSTGEIARLVGRSGETIRRAIKSGRLRTKMFNGSYAIPVDAFKEWEAKYFTSPK